MARFLKNNLKTMKYIHTIKTIVDADTQTEAKAKLAPALDRLEGKTGLDLIYEGDIEQLEEETNWKEYAKEAADDIIRDEQEKMLKEYIKPGIAAGKDSTDIWDDIYQGMDTYDLAHQSADGTFIYNSTKHLIDAMQCLDWLSEWDDAADSGILEGATGYADMINYSATYALGGAIHYFLEEKVIDDINARIAAKEAQEKKPHGKTKA
jgi:hypothetical protein